MNFVLTSTILFKIIIVMEKIFSTYEWEKGILTCFLFGKSNESPNYLHFARILSGSRTFSGVFHRKLFFYTMTNFKVFFIYSLLSVDILCSKANCFTLHYLYESIEFTKIKKIQP